MTKKNETLRTLARRSLSQLLAVATVLPFGVFAPRAKAVQPNTRKTRVVVWDKNDNLQNVGSNANHGTKGGYSRIMFATTGSDGKYYFFQETGSTVSTYGADAIYVYNNGRVEDSAYSDWNSEFNSNNSMFYTVGGQRTPYIQYAGNLTYKSGHTYQSYYLLMSDWNDDESNVALCPDPKDSDNLKHGTLYYSGTFSGWDDYKKNWKNGNGRIEPWVIGANYVASAGNRKKSYSQNAIWHWNLGTLARNEYLRLENGKKGQYYKTTKNTEDANTKYKVYLGRQYDVDTMTGTFTVDDDQISTLGRPLFYVPKDCVITVKSGGVLSVDGMLLNDGTIRIEDGGLLVLKDKAKIMPFSKHDDDCGHIESYGGIVVQEDSMLCGGAVNGISILGGGVINYGIIAAEDITITENFSVENKKSGYVIAGKSPTLAARTRLINEAIINEGKTGSVNPRTDFAKNASTQSKINIVSNAFYGVAENVVEEKTAVRIHGTASDPVLSVYTRSNPTQEYKPLFEDERISTVGLSIKNGSAEFSIGDKVYAVPQKTLIAASVGRGSSEREALFTDQWFGPEDDGYVKLSPSYTSTRVIGVQSGSGSSGANVEIQTLSSSTAQLWKMTKVGNGQRNGRQQPYYSFTNAKSGLMLGVTDTPGVGSNVAQYTAANSQNQNWYMHTMLADSRGAARIFYNRANPEICMSAVSNKDNNYGWNQGSNIIVSNDSDKEIGRWRISNLFSEASFAQATTFGAAVELVPKSDANKCLRDISLSSTLQVEADTRNATPAQRWTFHYSGTDNLNGALTPYYTIKNVSTGKELDINGGYAQNQSVVTQKYSSQYWYVTPGANNTYSIICRGNTNFALALSGKNARIEAANGSSGQQWQLLGMTGLTRVKESEESAAAARDPLKPDNMGGRIFILTPKNAADMAVGMSSDTGDTAVLLKSSNAVSRMWRFEQYGQTSPFKYRLVNVATGKQLDQSRDIGKITNGNVDGKVWLPIQTDDGFWRLQPYNQTLKLSVKGGGTESGTELQCVATANDDAQKWTLTEVSAADVLDGQTFALAPAHATDMRLNVVGGRTADRTTLDIQPSAATEAQLWSFHKAGTVYLAGVSKPYFTITSVLSGKNLDSTGLSSNGATPWIYEIGGDNVNQQWFVENAGNGYFTISPRNDPTRCIGVTASGKTAGTAAILWDKANNDDQKWRMEEASEPEPVGTFMLASRHAPTMYMALNASEKDLKKERAVIDLRAAGTTTHALWTFERMGSDAGGDYFRIVNKDSGLAIDVPGVAKTGVAITQSAWDGAADRLWYLDRGATDDNGQQYFFVKNRSDTTLFLEVDTSNHGGGTENGATIHLNSKHGGNSQHWKLAEDSEPVELGNYEFAPADAPDKRLEPGSSSSGTRTYLRYRISMDSSGDNTEYQTWKLVQRGSDMLEGSPKPYYSIESMETGKALGVAIGSAAVAEADSQKSALETFMLGTFLNSNSLYSTVRADTESASKGTAVPAAGDTCVKEDYLGYTMQHWYMELRDDNTVVFLSRANPELALEISDVKEESPAIVNLYKSVSATNQRWQLHPVLRQKEEDGTYYIPGNEAAAKAGLPFVPAADTEVATVGGTYYVHLASDEEYVMCTNQKDSMSSSVILPHFSASLLDKPAFVTKLPEQVKIGIIVMNVDELKKQMYGTVIEPAGVEYFDDDEARVVYRIHSPYKGGSGISSLKGFYPIGMDGTDIAEAGKEVKMKGLSGQYNQLWYLDEVDGKQDTYYIIARGTWQDKVCLETDEEHLWDGAPLVTNSMYSGENQQWHLVSTDAEEKEDKEK